MTAKSAKTNASPSSGPKMPRILDQLTARRVSIGCGAGETVVVIQSNPQWRDRCSDSIEMTDKNVCPTRSSKCFCRQTLVRRAGRFGHDRVFRTLLDGPRRTKAALAHH